MQRHGTVLLLGVVIDCSMATDVSRRLASLADSSDENGDLVRH
jgi:hypothetical protein